MQLAELVQHALALSPDDRICLMEKIEESLPFSNDEIAEIERRAEDCERAEAMTLDLEVVMADLKSKFKHK